MSIFKRIQQSEVMMTYLQETELLDVVIPTVYLRIINDRNEPQLPLKCDKKYSKTCNFKKDTKFEDYETAALQMNQTCEIMTERYMCLTHNTVMFPSA